MTQIETEIIKITDANPSVIAIIRAMSEVMTAPAMDQTSRYGTQTSRYMIILKHDANKETVKNFIMKLGVTVVKSEFG